MPNYQDIFYNNNKVLEAKHSNEFEKILQRIDYTSYSGHTYFSSAYYKTFNSFNYILNNYPINLNSSTTSVTGIKSFNLIENYNLFLAQNDAFIEYLTTNFPNTIILTDNDGTTGSYVNIYRDVNFKCIQQTDLDYIDNTLTAAQVFDDDNDFNIIRFLPGMFLEIDNNHILENFLYVLGQSLDLTKFSVDQLANQRHFNYTNYNKYGKGNEVQLANLLGFNLYDGSFDRTLSQYLLKDGFTYSLKEIKENIWNRILNNLPYLYKTKGTLASIKALLNCYGISNTIIKLKEYSYTTQPLTVTSDFSSSVSSYTTVGRYHDYDKIKIGSKSQYVKNLNEIGISFQPIDEINKDIINWMTLSSIALNFNDLIADTDIYNDGRYYNELEDIRRQFFETHGFDLNVFQKFVEDFDKGLFDTAKQLIPASSKLINEGIHIESPLLERTRVTNGKIVTHERLDKSVSCDVMSLSSQNITVQQPIVDVTNLVISNITIQNPIIDVVNMTATSLLHSVTTNANITRYEYDSGPLVQSTDELTLIEIDQFDYNLKINEHKFNYIDKYINEDKYITNNISSSAGLNLIATFTDTSITGITSGVSSSNCTVNYTKNNNLMPFSKIKIVIPTSSSGDRLFEVTKNSALYDDYFQCIDCSNSGITANTKFNVFEFYTDYDGNVGLTFVNNGIRSGNVPVYFYGENELVTRYVTLTISGTDESGGWQTKQQLSAE